MALEKTSFQEIMMNSILTGKQLMYSGSLETILTIKFEPKTRQVIVETVSGKIFTCFKDDLFEFDVATLNPRKVPNSERAKGKE